MGIYLNKTTKEYEPQVTLAEVKEKILAAAAEAEQGSAVDVTVELDSGRYRAEAPVVLSAREHPELARIRLTVKAKSTMRPIVSGIRYLSGADFTPVEGTPYYKYQLERDENGEYPKFHDLFLADTRLAMAKSPIWRNPFPLLPEERSGEKKLEGLYAPMDIAKAIVKGGIGATELRMYVQWEHYILRVKDVDLSATKDVNGEPYALVTFYEEFDERFVQGVHRANNIGNRETFFTNNLAFLTEPDTFAYDWKTGVIYVVPSDPATMARVRYGYTTLTNYFVFEGMRNVTVEGLTFAGLTSSYVCDNGYFAGLSNNEKRAGRLRDAAIVASDMRDFTVKGCTFLGIGANGVQLCDSQVRGTVADCVFKDIAMGGISVGNFDRKWEKPENKMFNIKVVNNYLEHIAYDYPNAAAIFLNICDGAEISHNTVRGCGYSGVFAGHGWSDVRYEIGAYVNLRNVVIAYNDIKDFMDLCRDGAAIYMTGGNADIKCAERINEIHHNYAWLDEARHADRRGYYLDGSASNFYVYDNVIHNCALPLFTQYHVPAQYTHHCTVENFYSTTWIDPTNHKPHNDVICINCQTVSGLDALFAAYPEAKAIAEGAGFREPVLK